MNPLNIPNALDRQNEMKRDTQAENRIRKLEQEIDRLQEENERLRRGLREMIRAAENKLRDDTRS